jgi:hypothetical protein
LISFTICNLGVEEEEEEGRRWPFVEAFELMVSVMGTLPDFGIGLFKPKITPVF